MNEGVFISDLQPGHPPALHVGMIAIGYVDAPPAARLSLIPVIEILDAMQIVKVPEGGSMLAVDFKRVERLVTARITRRFKRRERSVLEPAKESARIVNPDRLDL